MGKNTINIWLKNTIQTNILHSVVKRATLPTTTVFTKSTIFRDSEEAACARTPAILFQTI
jgi:hypothetical protein